MADVKRNEIDMTQGALLPKILLFSIPLMLSSMMQLLFNAADIIVVGRFAGPEALAAVGSNTALITLITNLFIGLSIGSNVLTAKYMGARREHHVEETVHTSIAISIAGGIFLLFFGIIGARQFLIWMKSPAEVLPLATIYLRIYFLCMPALLLYNFGASILRAVGNTKAPLWYLSIAGVVNVLMNLFLVIVCNMGVAGVAIATAISQYVSAGLILRNMMMTDSWIRLDVKRIRIVRKRLDEIMRIGLPASFQGILFSISNVVIQSSVNSFGATVVAGNTAAANLEGFIYMAMNSFHQSSVSFTGQNFGARKPERILRTMFLCMMLGTLTGLIMGVPAYLNGHTLLKIYSTDEAVIAVGIERLKYISLVYFLCSIMEIPVGTLRGMGYGMLPAFVSMMGACVFRLIWIATVFQIYHTPQTLYLSYAISWIITASAHYICVAIIYRKTFL